MCVIGLDVVIRNETKNYPRESWFETMKDMVTIQVNGKDYRIR